LKNTSAQWWIFQVDAMVSKY